MANNAPLPVIGDRQAEAEVSGGYTMLAPPSPTMSLRSASHVELNDWRLSARTVAISSISFIPTIHLTRHLMLANRLHREIPFSLSSGLSLRYVSISA